MSSTEDPNGRTPRPDLLSAVTHPFLQFRTADQYAAVRERLNAVAADLRHAALEGAQPADNLLRLANKLETLATEDQWA